MNNSLIISIILILGLMNIGCSVFKEPMVHPLPDLPKELVNAPNISDLKITASLLDLVEDDQAKALVTEALVNNHDLQAAALRLKSAGLLLSQTGTARLPNVEGGYTGSRNNQSLEGEVQSIHRISLAFSWELDIWGKLADQHHARENDYKARKLEYYRAMDSLATRVLQAWFRIKANKMNLDVHAKRVKIYQQMEETILEKYKAGLGDLQDISTARSRTNLFLANQTEARNIYQASVRDLELLMGRYPATEIVVKTGLPEVHLSNPEVPAFILANRPDVQAAVKMAESAMNEAIAGHKELLPNITLTGNLFRENSQLRNLGSSKNAWDIVGNLLFPIFNAGRIKDQAKSSDALAQAAYRDLGTIVLQAMKEAENTFSKETHLRERLNYLEMAMRDARKSSDYYQTRFKEGLTSIIELHTARDQELEILSSILEVKALRIINRVDIALALGTGVLERNDDETI